MIYQFKCKECKGSFTRSLPMMNCNIPLTEPCPACGKEDVVYRDFSSTSITYDTVDVTARARRVSGEAFTQRMKQIKNTYRGSTIRV